MKRFLLAMVASAALLAAAPVLAACSRVITVPVAQFGYGVVVKGNEVSGIFPSFLQGLSDKAGCTFKWTVVPRARIEAMFEAGTADMLLAAAQTDKRDQAGRFVPLISARALLLSLNSRPQEPISNFRQLADNKALRVVLVRGFDYGPAYRDLIKELTAAKRVSFAIDPLAVARMLVEGMADASIIPPSAVLYAAQNDARVTSLLGKLRMEVLDELPWIKSGIYLSRKSLSPQDQDHLEKTMSAAARNGSVYKEYVKVFSPDILKLSLRPL